LSRNRSRQGNRRCRYSFVKSGIAPAIVTSLIRRSSTAVNEIVSERLAAKPLAPEIAAIGLP
jgi:hypothetical protein